MALMRPVISVPELTYWSTTAGNTLDPDTTSGDTVPIVKATGWTVSQRPPAKVMNWIHNIYHQWNIKIVSSAMSNWFSNAAISGTPDVDSIVHNPYRGLWCASEASTTNAWVSYDGHVWAAATAFPGAVGDDNTLWRDTTNVISSASNGDLYYSSTTDLSSWSTIAAATIGGGTAAIKGLCTKAPGSDYAIAMRQDGTTRIASSGITGSWAAPTVAPSVAGGPASEIDIIYTGSNSTWLILYGRGSLSEAFISTDDGDNWSALTLPKTSEPAERWAYEEASGRLVLCGKLLPSDPYIEYSDDNGASWTSATLPSHWPSSGSGFRSVYACGSGVWIALPVITFSTPALNQPSLLISTDNAETWSEANMDGLTADNAGHAIWSDGKKLVIAADSGVTIASLAIC